MFIDKWNGPGVFMHVYLEKQMAHKMNVTCMKTWADVLTKVNAMVSDTKTVATEFQLPGGKNACITVNLDVSCDTPNLFCKIDTLPV